MCMPQTVNIVIAGNMDDSEILAAVGVGATLTNLIVLSFLLGLNGAQENLTSQAFGNGQLELCGVYLNRGRAILIAFALPIVLLVIFFGEDLLTLMRQDQEVSKLAAIYMNT